VHAASAAIFTLLVLENLQNQNKQLLKAKNWAFYEKNLKL